MARVLTMPHSTGTWTNQAEEVSIFQTQAEEEQRLSGMKINQGTIYRLKAQGRPKLDIPGCYLFIRSGYFYSASSSPLLLRGAPDTARILYQSFTPKRHRQLLARDLPEVTMWQKHTTLQTIGVDSTNEPPRST